VEPENSLELIEIIELSSGNKSIVLKPAGIVFSTPESDRLETASLAPGNEFAARWVLHTSRHNKLKD
jgi:hypothetical protein